MAAGQSVSNSKWKFRRRLVLCQSGPERRCTSSWSVISVLGPMGRTVADTALMLSASVGRHTMDPLSVSGVCQGWPLQEADLSSLRIGTVEDFGVCAVDPGIRRSFRQRVAALARHTRSCEPLELDLADGHRCFDVLRAESFVAAFADTYRYVSDRRTMQVTPEQMLDSAYLASRAKLIDPRKAQSYGPGHGPTGGTIYLTAADQSGMMVSLIQSNYMGFGSGIVVPGYGVSLQNRGHGFTLDPSSDNLVGPGKRPFHTIIPAFLTQDGQPVMSYGVMGANMQPQGHMQTLVRMLDYGQNPQTACDAPRWRYNAGLEINVEAGMDKATVQGLAERGHRMEVINDSYQDFGAGQCLQRAAGLELGDARQHQRAVEVQEQRRGGERRDAVDELRRALELV